MDRRTLITTGLAAASAATLASTARGQDQQQQQQPPPASDANAGPPGPPLPSPELKPAYAAQPVAETYSRSELVNGVSDFLGVSAEAAAGAIERIFKENGQPTGYIAGEEGSVAFFGGLRYGSGLLYMKSRQPTMVFWRGPSFGFDFGGNVSRVFTLCYNLQYPEFIYRRFPGVEGSAYIIGGLGVNYQHGDDVTLAPIRTGLGLRLGANIGYQAYSRKKILLPF